MKLELFLNLQHVFPIFSSSKIKCPIACALTLFKKFLVVDAMCNATYYSKTCQHLRIRVDKHSVFSLLTWEKSKSKKSTAVKDHMLFFVIIFYPLITLKFWQPVTQISMLRSKKVFWLLISHDELILNKNETLLPLYLFDWSLPCKIIF